MSPGNPSPIAVPPQAHVITNPYRGAEVEEWLKRRGARYLRCVALPIELFDERASRQNQARGQAVVQEAVDRYTVMWKQGRIPPPVVAYRPGETMRFVMIDGNQRLASGKKASATHLPTFILAPDTPSELIQLLTVEANSGSSEPVALAWRIKQAYALNDNGWTEEQACEAAVITVSQLRHYKSLMATDERARALNIQRFTSLSDTNRHKLGQIKSDPVLTQATRVAIECAMTTEDVKDLVRAVKATGSEAEAFSKIAQVEEDQKILAAQKRALNQRSNAIRNVQQSLVTGIGKVVKVDIGSLLQNVKTDFERQQLWDRLQECADKVLEIQAALEPYIKGEREAN